MASSCLQSHSFPLAFHQGQQLFKVAADYYSLHPFFEISNLQLHLNNLTKFVILKRILGIVVEEMEVRGAVWKVITQRLRKQEQIPIYFCFCCVWFCGSWFLFLFFNYPSCLEGFWVWRLLWLHQS